MSQLPPNINRQWQFWELVILHFYQDKSSGLGKGIKNFRSQVKTDKKNSEKKEKITLTRLFLWLGVTYLYLKKKDVSALNLRYDGKTVLLQKSKVLAKIVRETTIDF